MRGKSEPRNRKNIQGCVPSLKGLNVNITLLILPSDYTTLLSSQIKACLKIQV